MKFHKLLLTIALAAFFSVTVFGQKMNPRDIVDKHLASIGSPEKLSSLNNQIILCDVSVKIQGSTTPILGQAVIASSKEKNIWGMKLNSNSYPMERFGYDGKNSKIAFSTPGTRSLLGFFLFSYPEILKNGLLGGTLTSSWALMATKANTFKVSYQGEKKIDGKDTYVLSYSPKSGSDLDIRMYFDKSNFHHLRTEYNRVVAASVGTGGVDSSTSQGEDRYKLIEDFSDYKDAGGLSLPGSYKISYSYFNGSALRSSNSQNREATWTFVINNFSYNQPLDANSFDVDAN